MHSEVTIRPLGEPGDLGWVVMAHGELYFQEFGWDTTFEALVARIIAEYAMSPESDRQTAWIAERNGRRVGCVFCCTKDERTAQLRLLLTDPSARGEGVGSELLRRCVDFALQAGYEQMVLWTNDVLVAAARLYLAAGFTLIEEEPHHSFGTDLVGQIYELELTASSGVNEPSQSARRKMMRRVGAFPSSETGRDRVARDTKFSRRQTTGQTEGRTAKSATLRLSRDVGSACFELRRGRFEILVDGKPVGSLANHDTIETPLEPGRHNLVLHKDRYSSRTLNFDAADGEVVNFRCNGARIWPTYVASIVKTDLAISLRRD